MRFCILQRGNTGLAAIMGAGHARFVCNPTAGVSGSMVQVAVSYATDTNAPSLQFDHE